MTSTVKRSDPGRRRGVHPRTISNRRLRWGVVAAAVLLAGCPAGDKAPDASDAEPSTTAAPTGPGAAATVGRGEGGPAGEFPPGPVPEPVDLAWLRREGDHLRAEDGRSFEVRGIDYAFNDEGFPPTVRNLTDADLDRIRGWGTTVVRIRLRDVRAGLYPSVPAEPGYLEELDRLIARINERGMYVILGSGGPYNLLTIDQHPGDPLFDSAKFLPANPAREAWMDHLDRLFDRYRDVPGIIGFDPVNEDISFPRDLHDAVYLESAHTEALARLRDDDQRHVYFQQPSGWTYQGFDVGIGHDLDDDNRFFCVKWGVTPRAEEVMARQVAWAEAAGTRLFVCEYALADVPAVGEEAELALQDEALRLIDAHAVGSTRLGYGSTITAGLIEEDGSEAFWLEGLVQPQASFVGGAVASAAWDRVARHATMILELDGSGVTEVLVPIRLYPDGFAASAAGNVVAVDPETAISGGPIRWDPATATLTLDRDTATITLEVSPR